MSDGLGAVVRPLARARSQPRVDAMETFVTAMVLESTATGDVHPEVVHKGGNNDQKKHHGRMGIGKRSHHSRNMCVRWVVLKTVMENGVYLYIVKVLLCRASIIIQHHGGILQQILG